jgi:hypothetical protein
MTQSKIALSITNSGHPAASAKPQARRPAQLSRSGIAQRLIDDLDERPLRSLEAQFSLEPLRRYRVVALQLELGAGQVAKGDHYDQMANECLRLAGETDDRERKALFLTMAQTWRQLAGRARASEISIRPSRPDD